MQTQGCHNARWVSRKACWGNAGQITLHRTERRNEARGNTEQLEKRSKSIFGAARRRLPFAVENYPQEARRRRRRNMQDLLQKSSLASPVAGQTPQNYYIVDRASASQVWQTMARARPRLASSASVGRSLRPASGNYASPGSK